ncbi:MAG TPA: phospho-N-acetylmuramoyl-pentapeptide-transferase [Candidatus Ozemobacteraceae bacterium]|nr:phospho-N-acetylmuramoyl-pentapeptide-transferase [Candidatus Ozemobacteraceae bacterium]
MTVRILFALVTSFLVAVFIGPRVIDHLKNRQIGQTIREEGVQEHKKKAGIPTMGGLIILIPFLLTTILWARWHPAVGIVLFTTFAMAMLGATDDLTKVIKARSLGLTPRQKLAAQILTGLVTAYAVKTWLGSGNELATPLSGETGGLPLASTFIQVPWLGIVDLGALYIPFVAFVIVAFSNAVNLTDGLDGLAGSVTLTVLVPMMVITFVSGVPALARGLGTAFIPGSAELTILAAALFGGCLGFLWYNANPAQVFMGDTGSMALGGAVAALAVCTRTEFFLALIGGVYVTEAVSVVLQVSYFKYSGGKRIFRMSPIHHHFELCGWAEQKVVARFTAVSLLLCLGGLALFAMRLAAG